MERNNPIDDELARNDRYMQALPLISAYLKLKYPHIRTLGRENIPDGPAMFVANHIEVDDSLIIAATYAHYMKSPLRLGAKSEYFEGLGIDNQGKFGKTMKRFVESTQQIPVYRADNVRGAVSLGKDIKYRFGKGESVLLHAEGTRTDDGRMNKFQTGAAAFAIKYGVPFVPTSITYPKKGIFTIPTVQFGAPLELPNYGVDFSELPVANGGMMPPEMKQGEFIKLVSEVAEHRVAAMSGQEQSGILLDPYAKKKDRKIIDLGDTI
jgi:1-acyl-sn-glycerol-3-phosphate acyltransferase